MSKDTDYTDVLLEDINSKFDRIVEIVGDLSERLDQKADAKDLQDVKSDIKIIKAVVTDESAALRNYERRLTQWESKLSA